MSNQTQITSNDGKIIKVKPVFTDAGSYSEPKAPDVQHTCRQCKNLIPQTLRWGRCKYMPPSKRLYGEMKSCSNFRIKENENVRKESH